MRRMWHLYRTHKKGIGKIIENPIVIGALAGIARNIVQGKSPIDVEKIKTQITAPNATNPLLFLGAGLLLRNKTLQAIGAFLIVDPPEEEQDIFKTPIEYTPPSLPIYVKTQ